MFRVSDTLSSLCFQWAVDLDSNKDPDWALVLLGNLIRTPDLEFGYRAMRIRIRILVTKI
jgi:hypothetical protein